ncbi:hypothetical protein MKX03_037100, partial [Papaver bracteatum]
VFVHPARYRARMFHVSTYSSPKVLKWVRNLLSPAEKDKFLSTTIVPLLHLPMQTWSSALFHFLLASQISTGDEGDKGNHEEMRIMVCGKELSFGKKEFTLISGLSFRKSDHKFFLPATKPCLKMKYFPDEDKSITGKHLKLFLFGKVEDEDDDEQKSKKCSKKEDKKKSSECHQSINSNAECEIVKVPLESDDKDEVCDDIMWHKENAKRLVMLGLCEGPLVDDEEEDSLKNENMVENEDLFEKGEEENVLESKNIFVDEQVPEESNMDDEEDEEDLLGNENMVEEEDLFEKCEEEECVAPPSSQPDALCSRTSTSIIASCESFVKNAMIGHTEDLKMTVIGEMEIFKSAVKGQLEELNVQVSNSHKTMLNHMECLTAEIKSIKDKICGTQTYNALSKTKTGTPPGGHNEEGDFYGAAMQKPDVTPGNRSNSIELNPPYPYNPPNKEVDVSRPVAENICNSLTGKKRKRKKIKPCTVPVSPIIVLSDDVTKGQGRSRRKINHAPPLLYPYTPTGLVAKKNPKKQDIDDVNRFINLSIKEHGDNYDGDGTSLLSCSEYKLLLRSTGWLSGNVIRYLLVCLHIIDSALVLLHKSYPSNKSTGTWSYFESHLAV